MSFRALVVREISGEVSSQIEILEDSFLVERDLLVRVMFSTLNYKDGMVLAGLGRLVSEYPHIPGVDLVGEVVTSNSSDFSPGDKVIATGFRMGEIYFGGYSELVSISSNWAVHLPEGMLPQTAMAIGTAGLTSMLALMALETAGLTTDSGEVLVTGGAGGVGSTAIALLANSKYRVVASTGRESQIPYLSELGASRVIPRSALEGGFRKPLEKEEWAGAIDAVGGGTLGKVISQVNAGGAIAAVGLTGGNTFHASVIPFLLRGISLIGIDSVMAPLAKRRVAWSRLSNEMSQEHLSRFTSYCELEEVPKLAKEILDGKIAGRVVVKISS